MPMIVFLVALAIGATPSPQRYPDAWRDYLGSKRMVRDEVVPSLHETTFPDTLILIGTYATTGKARDVWVRYPYAYLASDWLGVEVIDISDPTNPTWVKTIDTPGQAYDLQMKGSLIYAADDYYGFQILDSSGIVGGHDTPQIAKGVFAEGNYAYVADFESLLVFDVTDPAVPSETSSLPFTEARGVYMSHPRAYVCEAYTPWGELWILDTSNPGSPAVLGGYTDPDYYFSPHAVYVDNWAIAYVANYYNELFIIDVSNPPAPTRVSFAYPPNELWGFAWDVKLSGSKAYVANYDGGLWVVDVSDPGSPKTSAIYKTPGLASGVFIDSQYVYVADYYSLLVFDQVPKAVEETDTRPHILTFGLMQNEPNPFSEMTVIPYQLQRSGPMRLEVLDLAGRLVKRLVDDKRVPGTYRVVWDGRDEHGTRVASGIYFCRLLEGSQSQTGKTTVLR
jgi:hypothetical protein